MTNSEIEKYKEELSGILIKIAYVNESKPEYFIKLVNVIKELQILSDEIGSRKYIGTKLRDMDSLLNLLKRNMEGNQNNFTIEEKCYDYQDIIKGISDNINFKLQTEMMLNACVYAEKSSELAKQSCYWATVAAIAACIGAFFAGWPSIYQILVWLF